MGFFDFFSGKTPESHEERGDEYAGKGAFGDARMEYTKALDKIEKRFPEKAPLKDRLIGKRRDAGNALARNHVENADAMRKAGDIADAHEFYRLAMDLVEDGALKKQIDERLLDMAAGVDVPGTINPAHGNTRQYDESDNDIYDDDEEYEEDEDDEYNEELFGILCNALPAEVSEAYESYGKSFVSGYVALNEGDFDYAVEQLENAMAENSPPNLIPLELATALIHLGEYDEAVDLLESFVSQNPEQSRAYQLLCEICWERKEHDRVARLLKNAPESIKNSRSILILEGENLFQKKNYSAAESVFKKYMDVHGKDEIVSRALAKTFEASGRTGEAIDLYAEIINSCMSCGTRADPFLKRRYAELCFKNNDTSSSLIDIYLDLAREDPDNRAHYFSRVSVLLHSRGEFDEAKRYEALAKKLQP